MKLLKDTCLSIHTIELQSKEPFILYETLTNQFFENGRNKIGTAHKNKEGNGIFYTNARGIKFKVFFYNQYPFRSVYVIINPRVFLGRITPIGLAKLDDLSLMQLEEKLKNFFHQWKLSYSFSEWKISRLDIAFQFYTKQPKLLIKLLRNHNLPLGYTQLLTNQNNAMRSFFAHNYSLRVQLYDKYYKMCRDKYRDQYTEQDWQSAKELLRFELQLCRHAVRECTEQYQLDADSLTDCLAAWRNSLPEILRKYLIKLFGENPYVTQQAAREILTEKLESGTIRRKSFEMISTYLDDIQQANSVPEVQKRLTKEQKTVLKRMFNILEINPVVMPDRQITKRERCHFPIAPLPELFSGPICTD